MNVTKQHRRENCLCVNCGLCDDRTAAGKWLCKPCREKQTLLERKRRERLMKEHRCTSCKSQLPDDWFYTKCESCKARERNNYYKRKKTAEAATSNGQHKKIS